MSNYQMPVKVCRYCAEEIKDAAKICPHCQHPVRGWILFIPDDVLALVAIGITFCVCAYLLLHRRDFSKFRDQIVVTDSRIAARGNNGKSSSAPARILAIATNKTAYAWEIGRAEVQFYDRSNTMVDVATAGLYVTMPPHSEQALDINLYGERIRSNVVSTRVFIRSAKEP